MKSSVILGFVTAVLAVAFYLLLSDSPSGPEQTDVDSIQPTAIEPTEPYDERASARAAAKERSTALTPITTEREEVFSNGTGTGAWSNALEGVVKSSDGDWLADVDLELVYGVSGDEYSELEAAVALANGDKVQRWTTKTDGRGQFRITNLPPGDGYRLRARHAQYTETYKSNFALPPEGAAKVDVVLGKGFVLAGRVVSDDLDEPVEGAQLELVSVMALLPGATNVKPLRARTDDYGIYEFVNVPKGTFSLTVTADDYASLTRHNLPFNGNPTASEPTVQNFRMLRALSMTGRVVSEQDEPIPGARIEARSFGTAQVSNGVAFADKRGEFKVENLSEGNYLVTASAKGFVMGSKRDVELTSEPLEVVLARQGGVSGSVLASAGGPAVGSFKASVRMTMPKSADLGRTVTQGVFKEETFELQGLNAGRYVVEVQADGYAPSFSEPFDVELGQTTEGVLVSLTTGGSIIGKLVSAKTGEPIAGATVRTQDNTFKDSPLNKILGAQLPRTTTDRRATTDGEGRFELNALSSNTYQLEISHRDFTKQWMNDIVVTSEHTTDLDAIKVYQGATVIGVVYNKSGSPVPGAKLLVKGMTIYPGNPRANDKGEFRITKLPAGTWALSAHRVGLANPLDAWPDITSSEAIIKVGDGETYEQNLYIDA